MTTGVLRRKAKTTHHRTFNKLQFSDVKHWPGTFHYSRKFRSRAHKHVLNPQKNRLYLLYNTILQPLVKLTRALPLSDL